MKVVLLDKIHNLGELGDVVNVKPGYGRNYLIPQGKAVSATKEKIAEVEARRVELEKIAAEALKVAQERAEKLKEMHLTITSKALEEGKLFGSVNVRDVVEALAEKGFEIEKREIILQEGPIHNIGEHDIELRLHGDVSVKIKLHVEAEK